MPVNTVLPTVTGTDAPGGTLVADAGQWTGGPTSYSYSWYTCGGLNDGSCAQQSSLGTSSSVTLPSHWNSDVLVRVKATNAAGKSLGASSLPITALTVPVNTVLPTVTGTDAPGGTLVADAGQWTGGPTSYSYSWYTCGGLNDGSCAQQSSLGTSSSVTLPSHWNSDVLVRVKATNAAGKSLGASSLPITAVNT